METAKLNIKNWSKNKVKRYLVRAKEFRKALLAKLKKEGMSDDSSKDKKEEDDDEKDRSSSSKEEDRRWKKLSTRSSLKKPRASRL